MNHRVRQKVGNFSRYIYIYFKLRSDVLYCRLHRRLNIDRPSVAASFLEAARSGSHQGAVAFYCTVLITAVQCSVAGIQKLFGAAITWG